MGSSDLPVPFTQSTGLRNIYLVEGGDVGTCSSYISLLQEASCRALSQLLHPDVIRRFDLRSWIGEDRRRDVETTLGKDVDEPDATLTRIKRKSDDDATENEQ